MHPVLFQVEAFPAWVAAAILALAAGVFVFLALRDRKDTASWWMAALFGGGAAALLAWGGFSGKVGPVPVRLFGILVVLGFLAGTMVVQARNTARGLLDRETSFDLCFYLLLVGLAGARAVHVMQKFDSFAGKAPDILKVWDGGLVWYGGAIASTLYAWYWLAKNRKDVWGVSDSVALGVALGLAVGRWGCFFAGCDYGKPADPTLPWAIHFPDGVASLAPSKDRMTGQPLWLHQAQVYDSLMNLAVFGILWAVDRRGKGNFPGRLVALYLVLYAVGRGVVEQWRGDADRGFVDLGFWNPSFSQFVSLFFLVGGLMLYRALKRRKHAPVAHGKTPVPS